MKVGPRRINGRGDRALEKKGTAFGVDRRPGAEARPPGVKTLRSGLSPLHEDETQRNDEDVDYERLDEH